MAREALAAGERGLARFSVQLLRPVQPMLADSAAGPDEALARVGEAAIEFKIDGARI